MNQYNELKSSIRFFGHHDGVLGNVAVTGSV